MPPGFYALIAAQFVSGLADNALLIVTIARLGELSAPAWWAALLKLGFTLAYVLLAPFVGAVADAWAKPRVMMVANALKAAGAALILAGGDPLLAFGLAGVGAALYSPAKYGLITELLPPSRLVAANGWIEVCTVGAILLGTLAGGALVSPLAQADAAWAAPWSPATHEATRLVPALAAVLALYALAAALNLGIPASGAARRALPCDARALLGGFARDHLMLWRDAQGARSLAVTTLFWGVGATLQLVMLRWAQESLGLGLHHAAMLQAAGAIGLVAGATAAGRWVSLGRAFGVLPLGIAMGLLLPCIVFCETPAQAFALLVAVGACAGFFVVPMNAVLQHRGHVLLSAGRSIAVQNFNENLGVIGLLAVYAALGAAELPLPTLIWCFGLAVAAAMAAITARQDRHAPPHPHAAKESA
ncbi:lysophospholipid transporter LplT [Caldimonas sp. KR1-144]|uniref:lysophospholipid transporter LplT n=1 Tax=Caldimonas sp. KR1-144 TaxID=3400911 RepID=UPI003C07C1BB